MCLSVCLQVVKAGGIGLDFGKWILCEPFFKKTVKRNI